MNKWKNSKYFLIKLMSASRNWEACHATCRSEKQQVRGIVKFLIHNPGANEENLQAKSVIPAKM